MKRLNLLITLIICNYFGYAQTLQSVTELGNTTNRSIEVGGEAVNSNNTKLFINNTNGKKFAISAGANMITENGLNIYNWTDNPTRPLFTLSNDGKVGIGSYAPQATLDVQGAAIINGPAGNTLTLQKISNNNPALAFKGLNSFTLVEAGDDQFSIWVGDNYRLSILKNGNVGIGTTTPREKLSVNGNIRAKEVKVEAANWPDYVFEKDYKVGTLDELESYIKKNKHLPNMPSAKEAESKGVELGNMVKQLLKNQEELTLHLIEKDKEVVILKNENILNKALVNEMMKDIKMLKKNILKKK